MPECRSTPIRTSSLASSSRVKGALRSAARRDTSGLAITMPSPAAFPTPWSPGRRAASSWISSARHAKTTGKMATARVLITSHTFRQLAGEHEQRLRAAGCEITGSPFPRPAAEHELLPLVRDVDAVIASTDSFTRRVFEAAASLRIVARFGVGYDAIDLAAATEHGVWITTTPGTNEQSVADLTLGLILALV